MIEETKALRDAMTEQEVGGGYLSLSMYQSVSEIVVGRQSSSKPGREGGGLLPRVEKFRVLPQVFF